MRSAPRSSRAWWMGALLALAPALSDPCPGQGKPRFEQVLPREGAAGVSVKAILQDSSGFLWLGTQDGLKRYDGYGFVHFRRDPDAPESLSHNEVTALHEDRSGVLWVGTQGGGLNRLDRSTGAFTAYRHDPEDPSSLSHDVVKTILSDRTGALWVGTQGGGLDRLDRRRGVFDRFRHDPRRPSSLSHDEVYALLEDRAGDVWVATYGGLDRLDRSRGAFVRYRAGAPGGASRDRVQALYEDGAGRLWVGTQGGLRELDRAAGRFRDHPLAIPGSDAGTRDVGAIVEGPEGVLWIGTSGGLARYRHDDGRVDVFRPDPADPRSLSDDYVRALYRDRSGVLWIGTDRGGAMKHVRRDELFEHHRSAAGDPRSLSDDVVKALAAGEDALWVGTWNGLNRLDPRTGAVERYLHRPGDPHGPSENRIMALHLDRAGSLWIATYGGGLDRLDPRSDRFVHHRHDPQDASSLPHDDVFTVIEDREGTVWAGTWGGGLGAYDRAGGRFARYPTGPGAAGLGSERIRVLYEDRRGSLWVGTDAGLEELDRQRRVASRFVHVPNDPASLGNDAVRAVLEDRRGRLWVGTDGGGLDRLERATGSFVHYQNDPDDPFSLGNNGVRALLEDREGVLWVGTDGGGLDRLDPESGRFTHYRHDPADPGSLTHDVVYALAGGASDELWVGTGGGGLDRFLGAPEVATGAPAPPMALTAVKVFGEPLAPSPRLATMESVALTHRDYVVSFEFSVLDFRSPERNQFAYRLEGLHDEWVFLGPKRDITFTHLNPGAYVFRVKGAGLDGVWNEDGVSIPIEMAPPPWRSRWAYLLYMLGLSAVLLGGVYLQRAKIAYERQIAERERSISARLREVDRLKDGLLEKMRHLVEERTAEVAERERLIAELEAKNTELERFTYTVSHDLKSPLVTIKGFLGLATRDAAAGDLERMEHDLERIGNAADKMQQLLDELLELSRVGRMINPSERVSLSELAHEAIGLLSEQAERSGARIEVSPELPTVVGDRIRLLEVLLNLIGNALKFSGDREPWIEVGARRDGDEEVFYVRDHGIGVDPVYREKIFGLFERLDASSQGTGIGLALTRRIVEVHGGRIWVESAGAGTGSTFCFTLPRGVEESAASPAADRGSETAIAART